MQIPSANPDSFIKEMSEKANTIRTLFLEHAISNTKKIPIKVMLADGTVSDQESFDPSHMWKFFNNLLHDISSWNHEGVSETSDQDLRRSFIKFDVMEDNYLLSGHMAIQYHALLFYKTNHRVIEIQKELLDVTDKINSIEIKIGPESDKIIEEKLREKGYKNLDHQKLFEILFKQEELTNELSKTTEELQKELLKLTNKRTELFKELDEMLIETYHISPILIDEMKMIAAEEGCFCNFNLEYMRKDVRYGNITPSKISSDVKTNLLSYLDDIIKFLKN